MISTQSVVEGEAATLYTVQGNLSSCEIGPNGILSHLVSLNTQPNSNGQMPGTWKMW